MSNTTTRIERASAVITHIESANAVITMVKNQIKNETGKYATYAAENGVTPDTVAKHVKALREQAYPGIKADGRAPLDSPERTAKRFADKVRLGLRTAVGDAPAKRKEEKILTTFGLELLTGRTAEEIAAAVIAELSERA